MTQRGRIIICSSSTSTWSTPTVSEYSASKADANALGNAFAGEVERLGIAAHLVIRMPVDTPMFGDGDASVPNIAGADMAHGAAWLEELTPHVALREIVLEPATSGPNAQGPST